MGLIFLAFFLAVAQTNLISLPQSPPTQPWQVAANRDCSYEAVSPQSQKVSTYLNPAGQVRFRITPPSYDLGFPKGLTAAEIWNTYQRVYKDDNWVLVKRNARIEKGKVFGGAAQSIAGREMDVIGQVKENGMLKWMFAGLGHCDLTNNDVNNNGCWDPLTKVTLYVLQAKGGDGNPPRYSTIDADTNVPISPDPNFWVFNVYISEKLLQENHGGVDYRGNDYSSDDLPCWLTECLPGDYKLVAHEDPNYDIEDWNASCQKGTPPPALVTVTINPRPTIEVQNLAAGETYPPSFIKAGPGVTDSWFDEVPEYDKSETTIPRKYESVPEYEWFYGKTSIAGTQPYGTMKGRLGNKEVEFTVSLKRLETAGNNDIGVVLSSEGNHYLYVPTDFSDAKQGENLKLGTFKPTVGYVYQWWYPSCKPVIYLYPEKETSFDVTLKPFGILTKSIPSYPYLTGWKGILAKPSGELSYQGEKYDSLYFEGKTFFVKVPREGFTIKGAELSQFFDVILPKLGLIGKEITDFKAYWLFRLNDSEAYYFVAILPREEIDRVEGLKINPSPDTLIRVRLFFKKLSHYEFSPLPDLPVVPERKGTTVVDWGGFYKE